MRSTRSSRCKSQGNDSKPTTSKKRSKSPNKELADQKPEEGTECKKLREPLREFRKPTESTRLTENELAEFAMRDYNKKHGTDLEVLRVLHCRLIYSGGYLADFSEGYKFWRRLIFEARRRNADTCDERLLLFAEVCDDVDDYYLNTLAPVKPADADEYCLLRCWGYVAHPRYGFRAGFDASVASEPEILSKQDAAKFSEFALQDYNKKHGTNVKLERALKCNSFKCSGLLMDFKEKNTTWVHMNLRAKVGPNEEVVRLFGELFLGDDDKYVLATLSVAERSEMVAGGKLKKRENECAFCPDCIIHPFRPYLYVFTLPPSTK